jgi:hypothetical protein
VGDVREPYVRYTIAKPRERGRLSAVHDDRLELVWEDEMVLDLRQLGVTDVKIEAAVGDAHKLTFTIYRFDVRTEEQE